MYILEACHAKIILNRSSHHNFLHSRMKLQAVTIFVIFVLFESTASSFIGNFIEDVRVSDKAVRYGLHVSETGVR